MDKIIPFVSPKILSQYKRADTVCVVNDNDSDLTPIEIKLPKCPPIHLIDGYGLPAAEQKFKREVMPKKLYRLQNEPAKNEQPYTIDEIWKELANNKSYYKAEIKLIEKHWYHRLNGYWFFNNGKPTYIDGWHWFYLNFWELDEGLPEYRSRDRKFFLFARMCYNDPLCYGFNYPKHRREGATSKASCINYEIVSRSKKKKSGIQSMTEKDAENVFQNHIVQPWKTVPFYFKPLYEGSSDPKTVLRFNPPAIRMGQRGSMAGTQKGLNSSISFRNANTKAYDGHKLIFYHADEVGKCLAFDTGVIMYDGSVKKIQDVVPGEIMMGDDSTPRTVLSLGRGQEKMYEVIPTKGNSWKCNESHILSLRWCLNRADYGWQKDQIINISVKDYLRLSKHAKKHLVGWRTGVEYKKNDHYIDPYILGVWLGDGDSKVFHITSKDKEIESELLKFCSKKNLPLKSYKEKRSPGLFSHHIIVGQGNTKSILHKEMNRMSLFGNKHIPVEYLIDSRENRLQLLAGLIDTDGYKQKSKNTVEIVQKRKTLAENICRLANSVGFYSSIKNKVATMKREDGTIYKCDVYRVVMFGDLHHIPNRIPKKKCVEVLVHNKNRRNPMRFGFKLKECGVENYYGVTLNENRLFLLEDFTVTHNTIECDIRDRWNIAKHCLAQGKNIIGFCIQTSTVGEMEKEGGINFRELCKNSDYHKRSPIGQTGTGLYTLFISGADGLESFIDEYGDSKYEEALNYLKEKRKFLLLNGDFQGLDAEIRQTPIFYKECFRTNSKSSGFNLHKIEQRLEFFRFGNNAKVKGDFRWVNNIRDKEVEFVPNPDGRFWVSLQLGDFEANRKYWDSSFGDEGSWLPSNFSKFVAGGDAFKFNTTISGKKSNGGGAVFQKRDHRVDKDDKNTEDWKTHRFVCTYSNRPKDKDDYGEDMLMMCVYYGCYMFPELDVPFLWDYFEKRKYSGFLLHRVDTKTGKYVITPGISSNSAKQDIFYEVMTYIERHSHRENHDEFLEECKDIEGPEDMTHYDLFAAAGYALLGANATYTEYQQTEEEPSTDIIIHRRYVM